MATEKDEEQGGEEQRTAYTFLGSKQQGVKLGQLIVEGSTANPVRFAERGGVVELTDDEHAKLSKTVQLRKASDAQVERQAAVASSDDLPKTQAAQQRAQQTGQARGDDNQSRKEVK